MDRRLWVALTLLMLAGCASVKRLPDDAPQMQASQAAVDACSFTAHLKCIHRTGAETLEDGMHLQWTRHWFRMSYIGRACEREHGRAAGVALEALFAVPHYAFIAVGNGLGALLAPLRAHEPAPE
jgi:hypothetical protein